nr:tetratricopeptide repeat protein [Neptunicella marina]
MFYNNNGADYLLSKGYTPAFAYFRAALKTDPEFVPALINLGALYRLYGKYELAEQIYTKAIHLDPDNLNSLENLAILKEYTGNFDRARDIRKIITTRRQSNPYYHLIVGEEAYDRGDYDKALISLHTASRLDQHIHEIYFALAKTYYKLGDIDMSEQNLKLAKRNSISDSQRSAYQGKLELLSRNDQ